MKESMFSYNCQDLSVHSDMRLVVTWSLDREFGVRSLLLYSLA